MCAENPFYVSDKNSIRRKGEAMQRSRPLLAFLIFCISIVIIIALLQTLVYQSTPVAIFTESDTMAYTGELLYFNASASYDPDGGIVSYFWDFGDGTNTTGVFVEHSYMNDGNYTVTLTATDDDGATGTATSTMTIDEEPLEKTWVDGGIFGWCNGCCLAPDKMEPTDRRLLFSVSPAFPKLYWKVFTADEYTGFGWRRSTSESIVDEFPRQAANSEYIFTVELNTTAYRLSLPIPPPPSSPKLSRPNLAPSRNFTLCVDELADVYGIGITDPINKISIDYEATWHHTEINKSRISLEDIPQEIRTTYLQLPKDLPEQVYELSDKLENSSLNVFDQIFEDMEYLMTNFEYDVAFKEGLSSRTIEDDWVLSYLNWEKGICIDAATSLAVILRCQGIPARINFGFKPGNISESKVLYFSTGAHTETEAYLPPYGWVRFDATPPGTSFVGGLNEDYPAFRPCLPDGDGKDGDGKDGDGERIPTVTSITYVPMELVLRQELFYITGIVTNLTGESVHGMQVRIYIKENKEAKGLFCGQGFSEENGSFLIECLVPYDFEVGDYCVVAHSVGTAIYAPSDSDPPIRIGARTTIELHIQKSILVNEEVTVSGKLVDDNKASIHYAPIEVRIGGERIGEWLTNDYGEFNTTYQFVFNGTFEVNATFSGTEYFLSSSKSTMVNVYEPVIETSMDYLVRGEENEVKGRLMGGDIGVEGKKIVIGLDNRTLEEVKTRGNGSFSYMHIVDPRESLDHMHTLSFTIQEIGKCESIPIEIKARTRLNISAPQEVTQGGSFTFDVYLFDDLGLPIMNENIVVDSLFGTTQEDGKVDFSKYASLWLWFKDINLTCHFEGSEKYLSSKANAIVVTQPNFLLFIFPSAIVVSAVSAYLIRRRRLSQLKKKDREIKLSSKQEKPPPSPTKSPLKLVFLGILPPFPNVWGVGENLRIKCYLNATARNKMKGNKTIHFSVNGHKIGEERLSESREAFIINNFLRKGKYIVTAELKGESVSSMTTNVGLRIVDYREEITKLYKTFLEHLNNCDLTVEENTTARELESLLLSSGHFDREHVHNLISCFEEAEYSNHPITRSNYETMYLSLKGLNVDA